MNNQPNNQLDKPEPRIPSELGKTFSLEAINFITGEIEKVNKPLAELLDYAYCINNDSRRGDGSGGVDPVEFAEATEIYAQLGGVFTGGGILVSRKKKTSN